MRKPQAAAFGTRGVVPVVAEEQAEVFVPRSKRLVSAAPTRYGMIIKIAIVLWVITLLVVIFEV